MRVPVIYKHSKVLFVSLISLFFLTPLFGGGDHAEKKEQGHEEKESAKPLTDEKVKALNLPIAAVKSGSINRGISLFGKIELHPEKSMHVHPKNSGVIREVFKSTGDKVTAGTVLARVEGNAGIESYNLTSVIDGIILEKNVTVGQAVNEETEAFTVADTKSLIATFVAYPRDFAHLKTGRQIYLQGRSKKIESLSIFYISPLLQDKTRTGQLLAAIDNQDDRWISGQYVIGKVFTEKKSVNALLPISLLSDPSQENIKLFVKIENAFSARELKLGERDFESVEVPDLKEGDEYIALNEHELEHVPLKKESHDDHEK